MPCVCFWPAAMADVFDLPPSAAGQLASIRKGAQFTMLNVEDFVTDSDQHQDWIKAVNDEQLQQGLVARITDAFKLPAGALQIDAMGIHHFQEGEEDRRKDRRTATATVWAWAWYWYRAAYCASASSCRAQAR